jgi:hypothetical protein
MLGRTARSRFADSCDGGAGALSATPDFPELLTATPSPNQPMKPIQLAGALIGASLANVAFATTASAPVAIKDSQPTPTFVVEPMNLPRSFAGGVLYIEFTLDENGRPRDIRLPSTDDYTMKQQVRKAFSQWQFAGGRTDATITSKRFVLPLEVKPKG